MSKGQKTIVNKGDFSRETATETVRCAVHKQTKTTRKAAVQKKKTKTKKCSTT